jgi:hypothetical protein
MSFSGFGAGRSGAPFTGANMPSTAAPGSTVVRTVRLGNLPGTYNSHVEARAAILGAIYHSFYRQVGQNAQHNPVHPNGAALIRRTNPQEWLVVLVEDPAVWNFISELAIQSTVRNVSLPFCS